MTFREWRDADGVGDANLAKFTVDVEAFSKDDEPMLCLKIMVDFMKKPFFKIF